ncbi:hypothetical protein I3760_08G149200 [Carya illinoinensis]|uniref:glucan endo-1,3-beta-D-glucosidase n=1 Tax=Carya illinoinensis TaxID=32201 RepID=A0A8T1PVG9_CARIL|nr:glucan endo-1,3-beta-glucosidase 3-like isoform X1 [Carya illinoinensis]KAG2694521.1 hypothetical protein I3760_08G149200 [Carya illinoinensis]KAG6645834.1 hypothetical protein CIPAW_08G150900 [Carya illinoinensis]
MAEGASKCFFLFLFLFTVCSSGTLVGFSDHARGTASSSPARTISFVKLKNVTPSHIQVFVKDKKKVSNTLSDSGGSVDLYLSKSLLENLLNSQSSVVSWLKSHVMLFLPHVNINSIIVNSGNDLSVQSELLMLLSTLQSIQSALRNLHLESQVRVSVAFSMSFLEKLNQTQKRDLHRICGFIKKIGSYVMIEASIDTHSSMGHQFVQSMIEKAILTSYLLPHNEVPVVLAIKSTPVPSATEVAPFSDKVFKSLENNTQLSKQIVGFYIEVLSMDDLLQRGLERGEEEIFPSSHRELISKSHLTTILHDTINPPTVFPTTPISTPPVITSPDNPTPIVTVPATNPVTIIPANPGSTPLTVPPATPVTIPSTNPPNSPVPITNPVTTPSTVPGAPVTNPATTYPAPPGAVPVINPEVPPATTNAPAIPGQSWCVAKTGALEAALQSALDYACGMGGADCSQIQQGGSCFDPNTLQNHASYAFNSYYQKNPGPTSCDFEGTAAIVNDNPSTGSCIYLSSSASSLPLSSSSPTTASPTPTTIPTAPSSPGAGVSSSSPPTVFDTGDPASGTMPNLSPPVNSSTSFSSGLQPFIGCIVLVTSFVTAKIVLDM